MNPLNRSLDNWLSAARKELARLEVPTWIEQAVINRVEERCAVVQIAALRSDPAPEKKRRRWAWFAIPSGGLALLTLIAALSLNPVTTETGRPHEGAFVALAPLESIAAEARPVLLESQLPRAQLAVYGLPVDPTRADVPVRTEFLVSRNGRLLAVRFVQ